MNEFESMEKALVDGMRETRNKQGLIFPGESNFIKSALAAIIRENRYNYFTKRNGARDFV